MGSNLLRRVKSLEEKVNGKNRGGIPDWAMEEARRRLTPLNINWAAFHRVLGEPEPEPKKPPTEEDIIALAKKIAEFSSVKEYEASLPPPDTSAIDKALGFIKD